MTSTLNTLTFPLFGEPLPQELTSLLVRDDVLCWLRRGDGLVGLGETHRFTVTGPDRFLEADIWWRHLVLEAEVKDAVQVPGSGPVAFGSFAFSKTSTHESRMIVPELVVGARDGRAWLTHQRMDDAELSEERALAALQAWLSTGREETPVDLLPTGNGHHGTTATLETGTLSEADWMAAVAAGVAGIRTGALEKLVLARDVVATVPSGVSAARVLGELAVRYRECWTYGVDGLVGATPEMLIQVEGRTAQARVLAGTLDRRDADADDGAPLAFAERVLAGSEKQRHEHRIAIESLTSQLAPFSDALNAHDEPFILELPNVWHLASDVKAELTEVEGHVPTSLALINALHPTAAVCGTPTDVAGALIRHLENLDRGAYAGPVGWLDGAGNGEWGIALRGAMIEAPDRVRLYAGCGIVEGSDPETELAETWAKFRPMLESLGLPTT